MKPITRSLIAHCALLIALFAYILAGTPLVPFHGDESTILFASRDYHYWFIEGDIDQMLYSDTPVNLMEQELRMRNGIVSKILAGFAWYGAGYTPAELNEPWDWGGDYAYNVDNGHRPTEALLNTVRWSSSIFLAAGVFVIFALGWQLGGAPVAYIASIYYALNPALLLNGRRMMMEGSTTFFCLLVALVGIWFLRTWTSDLWARHVLPLRWLSVILLGVVSGLALSSKQIAAFAIVGVFGACTIYIVSISLRNQRWRTMLAGIMGIALASCVTMSVFVVLNPVWWGDPIARTLMALQDRQSLLNIQVSAFGASENSLGSFWRQVFVALPQYYEVSAWQGYLSGEIARYEASFLQGLSVGGSNIGGIILLLSVIAGIWALFRDPRIDAPLRTIIAGWVLVVTLAALLLTPVEWQRYYLLVYPPLGLLAVLGIVYSFKLIRARFTSNAA